MDFTNVKCLNSKCIEKDITMEGAGGHFGGRIEFVKLRCPECDSQILIVPIRKEFEYSISATTEEERKEKRIQEAREKSELELAKTINKINNEK
jgi:hypothetical protein